MDTVAITPNPYGTSPAGLKRSPPTSSRSIQHSSSGTGLGHQQNSKLIFDTSPIKSRQKLNDFDGKYFSRLFDSFISCLSS
jgi:hypothetical protein